MSTVLDFQASDLVTIALLIALEGLLSADNALVMAIMVLGLPRNQHKKALHYGLVGAFVFRIIATLLAVYLIQVAWVKLAGGLYLLYLTYSHFFGGEDGGDRLAPPKAKAMLGLSPLWATVVRVELVNLAFSIDSILVAVAMSPKRWVVVAGGVLGIVAMRLVVGQLMALVERYPALVDGGINLAGVQRLLSIAEVMQRIRPLMEDGALNSGAGRRQLVTEMRRLSDALGM